MARKKKETVGEALRRWISDDQWLAFSWLIFDFMELVVFAATMSLKQDMPTLYLGEDPVGGGKGVENPSAIDVMTVLHGSDMLRHENILLQATGFLQWLQNEEIKYADENEDGRWLAEKWNEYAQRENERKKEYAKSLGDDDLFRRFFHDQEG